MEAERFSASPDDTELGSRGAGILNQAVHLRDLNHKVTSTQKVFPKATRHLPTCLLGHNWVMWPSLSQSPAGDVATKREKPIETYHWAGDRLMFPKGQTLKNVECYSQRRKMDVKQGTSICCCEVLPPNGPAWPLIPFPLLCKGSLCHTMVTPGVYLYLPSCL